MLRLAAWLILIPLSAAPPVLRGPLVVSDRWPEPTDLVTWTKDVMRLEHLENAGETAQAKAFFLWLRLFSRMATGGMIQAYEGEFGHERYVTDAHKNLFVYGWGYCDTTSRIAEAAWVQFKNDPSAAERVCVQHVSGGYHTMFRLRLDGRYGAFDPRYGYYVTDQEGRVVDWAEVPAGLRRSRPFFERPDLEWERALALKATYFENEESWVRVGSPAEGVFGNRMYVPGTRYHHMDFDLPRGATIERFWDNSARAFYVPAGAHALKEEPFLPAGRFYRVTETMLDGNWPKHDSNYAKAKAYLTIVPLREGYGKSYEGGRTIGQAWGRITWTPSADQWREGVLDFYSPYVLVDGTLTGQLAPGARLEMRTLQAKAAGDAEPDVWSAWDVLAQSPAPFRVPMGKTRFDGKRASVHGVYRVQFRVASPPKSFRIELTFENGIMSLPQILEGTNTIRFKLRNTSNISGPIEVRYRYDTRAGEREHRQVLRASDFKNNVATYSIEANGLVRCRSIAISY